MSKLRIWLKYFLKPCPYGLQTLGGAALAALVSGAFLLMVHLGTEGVKQTVALFPRPVGDSVAWFESLFELKPEAEPNAAPWRRHAMVMPDALSIMETTVRSWRAGTDTFVRAPLRDDALPYSESPHAPLAEAVKQVDYALTQAMLRLEMDWQSFQLVSFERRKAPKDSSRLAPYLFQRLRVHVPVTADGQGTQPFIDHIQRMLSIWSERSRVEQPAPLMLRIFIDDTVTHELFFSPHVKALTPVPPDMAPRLTIVIDDMGASPGAAQKLFDLDFPFTCSIWPRAAYARQVAEAAWRYGQEVIIHQPCEPREYPAMNPGPGAVFVRMSEVEIAKIFRENIERVPHAVGFNNHMGSRLTADARASKTLSGVAADAGFFVLDSFTHPTSLLAKTAADMGITSYKRAIFLDDPLSPAAIRVALRTAEKLAKSQGQAIAIGHPHPETIAALKEWIKTRDTSIKLVPLRLQRPFGAKDK